MRRLSVSSASARDLRTRTPTGLDHTELFRGLGWCRSRSKSGVGPASVARRCRTRHQAADTKRTHQKRHARRRATHLDRVESLDFQAKVCRE